MTTLDVGISGPNGSIDLSNGLLGSASDVFFAVLKAHAAGKATGVAGASGCDLTMKGSVLLEFLAPETGPLHQQYSSSPEAIAEFHATIDPEADYRVGALEV